MAGEVFAISDCLVYNDFTSTYDALLHKSGKSLLYVNRIRSLASEVYKIINHIGPSMLHELFEKKRHKC